MRKRWYPPIGDYGIIGDCGTCALVSKEGSLDWLCLPRFDSPSLFAALLDRERGGRFRIRPTAPHRVTRRYLPGTNVLETTFHCGSGRLILTDLMPVVGDEEEDLLFWPDHEVLRQVRCEGAAIEVEVLYQPRPDYGRVRPRLERRGELGWFYDEGARVCVLRSEIPLKPTGDGCDLAAEVTLEPGEIRYLSLVFDLEEPAVLPALGDFAREKVERSVRYWRSWTDVCRYDGPFREAVVRSALTLKLLTYSRSGALVAAATTSLPEALGGVRNWDYRYCWLRDASFTLRALLELGYDPEGAAFFSWLLYAVGGTQPDLNVMYDVYGGTHLPERHLDHLEGYAGSRPVRIGNHARGQLQLDMYGEVVCGAHELLRRGGELNRGQSKILAKLGRVICERWREPDNGIWEIRSERRHHTYSKAMCWVGLKRLLELQEDGHVDVPTERFERNMREIRATVETQGFNRRLQSYTATLGGDEMDASLLLLPIYGYLEAGDPRMRSTFDRVQERLAHGGLLHRYATDQDDGLPGGEAAFGICSFWDEEVLALRGDVEEAEDRLAELLTRSNDLGLFAEEIDVETGELLGNFPQAFTHVGLINAALTIAQAQEGREQRERDEGKRKREIPKVEKQD